MGINEMGGSNVNNETPRKKRPYQKNDFVMHMDENKNIVSVHEGISAETIKQGTQYSLWQFCVPESAQEQIKIASLFGKHLSLVSSEQLNAVMKQPFHKSGCIDKDKQVDKVLNVPGGGMGWKAAMLSTLRKISPDLSSERIHEIITNVVNKLGGFSYHTDDRDVECVDDSCVIQTNDEHVHTPGCKHRELIVKDPGQYGLKKEDVEYMEKVKMPDDNRVPNVDREVIKRKTVKKEKDYTVIVSDARYLHETKGKQEDVDFPEFYYVPNVIEDEDEEGTTYRCYDYTKDLAHYVIDETITSAIKEELYDKERNDIIDNYNLSHADNQKIDATEIISSTLKHTLDNHMQITVTKALSHKEKVHIMPYEKRKIPNKKKR